MELGSNSPLAAFITGVFGVVSTLLAVYFGRRVQRKRRPKDRIETIFDGYDALIAQLRSDLDRKGELIRELERLVDAQATQLQVAAKENERLHKAITDLNQQLKESDTQAKQLELQLKNLRSVRLEA